MKAAHKAEAEKGQKETAYKKALSDLMVGTDQEE